jgi:tetratricopeptide (TPR) repeat protein
MVVMGEYDQAKDCYEEALKIRKALYTESDVSVAQVLCNIG